MDTFTGPKPPTKAANILQFVSPVAVISYYAVSTVVNLLAPASSLAKGKIERLPRLASLSLTFSVAVKFVSFFWSATFWMSSLKLLNFLQAAEALLLGFAPVSRSWPPDDNRLVSASGSDLRISPPPRSKTYRLTAYS